MLVVALDFCRNRCSSSHPELALHYSILKILATSLTILLERDRSFMNIELAMQMYCPACYGSRFACSCSQASLILSAVMIC